jgi:hypothetical protein
MLPVDTQDQEVQKKFDAPRTVYYYFYLLGVLDRRKSYPSESPHGPPVCQIKG